MKKIITLSSLLFSFSVFTLPVQEVTSESAKELIPSVKFSDQIQVKFGGFASAEYYIDSRTVKGAVDDLFGFFPKIKKIRRRRQ